MEVFSYCSNHKQKTTHEAATNILREDVSVYLSNIPMSDKIKPRYILPEALRKHFSIRSPQLNDYNPTLTPSKSICTRRSDLMVTFSRPSQLPVKVLYNARTVTGDGSMPMTCVDRFGVGMYAAWFLYSCMSAASMAGRAESLTVPSLSACHDFKRKSLDPERWMRSVLYGELTYWHRRMNREMLSGDCLNTCSSSAGSETILRRRSCRLSASCRRFSAHCRSCVPHRRE